MPELLFTDGANWLKKPEFLNEKQCQEHSGISWMELLLIGHFGI